ncbi:hypothetical protein LXM94_25530 [Rhizobium sp. TRM95111]|uniref:hypothetical protein n=1 Tax=Rhizobium alarense TaxID=2846851 RepID=UPI001F21C056|nr:hypothetical protein [Rhizobium alarense]MCF3643319.1 hypothetical protein [Rhizobium alarense]
MRDALSSRATYGQSRRKALSEAMFNHSINSPENDTMNHQQKSKKPAQASSKAMWGEARSLKSGDVIIWHRDRGVSVFMVDRVRFGWWRKVYIEANGGTALLTLSEDETVCIERGPQFHIEAVNINSGRRVRMTGYPMNEQQCRVMMSKIASYPWRRLELVEVSA